MLRFLVTLSIVTSLSVGCSLNVLSQAPKDSKLKDIVLESVFEGLKKTELRGTGKIEGNLIGEIILSQPLTNTSVVTGTFTALLKAKSEETSNFIPPEDQKREAERGERPMGEWDSLMFIGKMFISLLIKALILLGAGLFLTPLLTELIGAVATLTRIPFAKRLSKFFFAIPSGLLIAVIGKWVLGIQDWSFALTFGGLGTGLSIIGKTLKDKGSLGEKLKKICTLKNDKQLKKKEKLFDFKNSELIRSLEKIKQLIVK